jgi:predicted transcriptional regulator of viral defense system
VPYIEKQALDALLFDYKDPKGYISKLIKQKELIRLKGGFYLIQELVQKSGIPFEQISNLLYGPSYLSLESALSFYGIIPEAVHTYSSMTLGKAKEFQTEVGTFRYYHLNEERYTIGIAHKENKFGGFFIATPEKALADQVFQLCQKMTQEELFVDLTESKRIELSSLRAFDKVLMQKIADVYRSKAVENLAKIILNL